MTRIFGSEAARARVHARYRQALAGWPVPAEQQRLPTREGQTFVVSC